MEASKVIAPGADALWDTHIAGEGPDGRYFSFTWFSCGGTGALARKDGLNATAFPSGIAGVPVEVIETLSPVVVHRRELRPDSGGAGTFRGGLGQIMEFGVRTAKPYQFAGLYERIDFPPPPLAGGEPGKAGRLRTNNGAPLRAKETTMLPPDTVVTIEIPGGAGYGSPLERAPERVLADVRDGYITVEAARERYGVVVDTATWVADEAATHELRGRG